MANNYAPHKHGDIHKWLAKHPRFQMYGTHALCKGEEILRKIHGDKQVLTV